MRLLGEEYSVALGRVLSALISKSPEGYIEVDEAALSSMAPQHKLVFSRVKDRRVIRVTALEPDVEIRVVGASEPEPVQQAQPQPVSHPQSVIKTDAELARIEAEMNRQRQAHELDKEAKRDLAQRIKSVGPMRIKLG